VIPHFDAVIVGSGFGASVVAYRLANAGRSVCVLERGRSYPPGSFARSPRDMARNLWDPTAGLYGLFDIWSFRRMEIVVSSGLGGGSLIYANVLLRKDEHWFVHDGIDQPGHESWPICRADLEPHYDAVEEMMGATPYPFDHEPYASTPKTRAFRDAAGQLGLEWQLPKLAITFSNGDEPPAVGVFIREDPSHPNLHHRPRLTCRLCGECDVGCNDGSKNTLDYNYLSRAKERGADIRTLADVRRIEPRDGPGTGFSITYIDHAGDAPATPDAAPTSGLPPRTWSTITADTLVLGAGTLGTTYLLLRNRSAFPHIGPALGTRFSGNGDMLTFVRRSRHDVGGTKVPRWLDPAYGPVITSAIRVGDAVDGRGEHGRGFYLEDGGYPQFVNWVVEAAGAPHIAARTASFLLRRVWAHLRRDPRANVSADVSTLLGGGRSSGTTFPLLAMGRDVPDGVMRLHHGDLDVDWTTRTSEEYFSRVQRTARDVAEALGGRLSNWPLWLFKRVLTDHPVGGCPMGVDDRQGVVDRYGRVFNYPGLYVVDGSAMPGPVGANPSLTIAAFANLVAAEMLGEDAFV
jgi:cholesterol oxidase